jgi:hypothetical protein
MAERNNGSSPGPVAQPRKSPLSLGRGGGSFLKEQAKDEDDDDDDDEEDEDEDRETEERLGRLLGLTPEPVSTQARYNTVILLV